MEFGQTLYMTVLGGGNDRKRFTKKSSIIFYRDNTFKIMIIKNHISFKYTSVISRLSKIYWIKENTR